MPSSSKRLVTLALAVLLGIGGVSAPAQATPEHPAVDLALTFNPEIHSALRSDDVVLVARDFLETHSVEWSIDSSEFQEVKTVPGPSGLTTIRFQQFINRIPVMGSIAALTLNSRNDLMSAVIKTGQLPENNIELTATQAKEIAQHYFAAGKSLQISTVKVAGTKIAIASPGISPFQVSSNKYVWEVSITTDASPGEVNSVVVDDSQSKVVFQSSSSRRVADVTPLVCDLQTFVSNGVNTYPISSVVVDAESVSYIPMANLTRLPVCSIENSGQTPLSDSVSQIDHAAASAGIAKTVNYFKNFLNIDINSEEFLGNINPILNYGLTGECSTPTQLASDNCQPRISAFTNVCVLDRNSLPSSLHSPCNFANAFWTPWSSDDCGSGWCSAIFFGRGFVADDVVAHELSHGVTGAIAFRSTLSPQAAALSEAYSDFYGEAVDQANVDQNEVSDPKWLIGEDIGYSDYRGLLGSTANHAGAAIPGVLRGPFRNMKGVGEIAQVTTSYSNSVDEHQNSGPANRFAWLISNGGSQGGVRVSPIGTVASDGLCHVNMDNCTAITKMTKLTLLALQSLTSSSGYLDFSKSIRLACDSLRRTSGSGFTSSNCRDVNKALDGTGISDGIISYQSHPTYAQKSTYKTVSVTAKTLTKTPISGATVKLQLYIKNKWVTKVTARTNSSGKANLRYKWTSHRKYRVILQSSTALAGITGKTYSLRVR